MEACLKFEEPTSVGMKPEAEHQEVSKEHAAVKTGKAPSKQHGDQHLAARKPKELTQGDCGSQRKLPAACRKVYHHPRVAWRKRNTVKSNWLRDKVE
jgi:hypothetical protein